MVRISVCYESEDEFNNFADSVLEKFSMPHHHICSESPVFKKKFAVSSTTRLVNVRPWAFRVFVRWLHKGDIYYDSKRTEPTRRHLSVQDDSSELDITDEEWVTALEAAEVIETTRADYRNPETWPYSWLFELYVFACEYEVRLFRLDIQDTIHIKLIEKPVLPSSAELASVVKKLPHEDTLYNFLADWFSNANTGRIGRAKSELAEECSVLPSYFLCLSRSMRDSRHAAENCSICSLNSTDKKCSAQHHSKKDSTRPHLKPPYFYHEHFNSKEERSRCYWRWMSKLYHIRTIEVVDRVET